MTPQNTPAGTPSSSLYAAPLRLEPGFSRQFAALLGTMYSGALLSVWLTPFSLLLQSLLSALVLLSAWQDMRGHLLCREGFTLLNGRILLDQGGEATLQGAYVQPFLVVLRLKLDSGGRRNRVLFADALEAEVFRKLRVLLRHRLEK